MTLTNVIFLIVAIVGLIAVAILWAGGNAAQVQL